MEVGYITKAATFKSFPDLSYKNTQLLFSWLYFLIFFMRKTLTDDFWGLHKNMNCAFPLTSEAATGDVLLKEVFLKISQNPKENTCVRVSFE